MRVLYFAACRAASGCAEESVPVPSGGTVKDLMSDLARRHPALAAHAPALRVAVNRDFADPGRALREEDEVALLPPVQGGAGARIDVALTETPIDTAAVADGARVDGAGAVVTFAGHVRPTEEGKPIRAIEYEVYASMARLEMERIARQVAARGGVLAVSIVHRAGPVPPGEAAVAIAVGALHRAEAFEACREAIERVKETVPIWKRHQAT